MENITIQQEVPQRDSFVFYRSFKNAIDEVKRKGDKLLICQAIIDYALDQKEPQLEGTPKVAWLLIKAQLDANWRKYKNGCRGGESGKRGGRPRKNPTGYISETPNEKEKEKEKEKENDNINELETTNTTSLLSEIREYVREEGLNVDPDYFYDYYCTNGWKMGRTPMVDWKAAIRNWNRINKQSNNTPKTPPIYDL